MLRLLNVKKLFSSKHIWFFIAPFLVIILFGICYGLTYTEWFPANPEYSRWLCALVVFVFFILLFTWLSIFCVVFCILVKSLFKIIFVKGGMDSFINGLRFLFEIQKYGGKWNKIERCYTLIGISLLTIGVFIPCVSVLILLIVLGLYLGGLTLISNRVRIEDEKFKSELDSIRRKYGYLEK